MNHKKLTILIIGLLSFFILTDSLLHAQKIIKIRGSTKGVEGAGEGLVDIGTASRNLHPDEYGMAGAILIGHNSEAIVEVSKDPGAIGYVSIGSAERVKRKLGKIKRIKIDGIDASRENVKDKTYPIIRPLNLLTKGKPSGDVQGFIEFLFTPQGQNIVKKLDYIPIK